MKTQIITLAAHDDLVSVRDRMSWAKSPRILLVWPAREQIPLSPLDLRILQQHAAGLGAQLGLVTRRSGVRRDAGSFSIPVFNSTAEAQRTPWSRHHGRRWRLPSRSGSRTTELRMMKEGLTSRGADWTSNPVLRIGFFVLAVLAVLSIASLFVPRATLSLKPIMMEQKGIVMVQVSQAPDTGMLTGGVSSQTVDISASGSQTMRVESQLKIPIDKATGIVRFQSIVQSPLLIPAGTVLYSVTPEPLRFATLEAAQLGDGANEIIEVPVEALAPGAIGNVPADVIQGIEGSLGALATVSNPAPMEGGRDAVEAVASQVDREHLRAELLEKLAAEAKLKLSSAAGEDAVILPETLILASVDEELFDPPPGQAASVLSLTINATYTIQYVRGEDLRGLAMVALDAAMPAEYTARAGTLEYHIASPAAADGNGGMRFDLGFERQIGRTIDAGAVNRLIRGQSPSQALGDLQASLPLSEPPELRLTPPWWPWLPLIPFRIDVVIV
jgi:hypothetical protein